MTFHEVDQSRFPHDKAYEFILQVQFYKLSGDEKEFEQHFQDLLQVQFVKMNDTFFTGADADASSDPDANKTDDEDQITESIVAKDDENAKGVDSDDGGEQNGANVSKTEIEEAKPPKNLNVKIDEAKFKI